MSPFLPMFDASIAGSLASATLCSQTVAEPTVANSVGALPCAAARSLVAPPPQVAVCRSGWRRLIDGLLSLISGPTFERNAA